MRLLQCSLNIKLSLSYTNKESSSIIFILHSKAFLLGLAVFHVTDLFSFALGSEKITVIYLPSLVEPHCFVSLHFLLKWAGFLLTVSSLNIKISFLLAKAVY